MANRLETKQSMLRRCRGWDYRQPCIYMITLVLADRRSQALGSLVIPGASAPGTEQAAPGTGQAAPDAAQAAPCPVLEAEAPSISLSPAGEEVMR